jgi:hypothetical protein
MNEKIEPTNIIVFPRDNPRVETILTPSDVTESLEELQNYHVNEILNELMAQLIERMDAAGFDAFGGEADDGAHADEVKSVALILESIRSVMLRKYGIHHPFQNLSRKLFVQDSENENCWRIADNIRMSLRSKRV